MAGNVGHPSQGDASSSTHVLMCAKTIDLTTRARTYELVPNKDANRGAPEQPYTSTTPPLFGPFKIERHVFDMVLRPPKNTIQILGFNPSSHAAQNYSIVQDLAKAPFSMSTLEVINNFPSQ